MWLYDLLEGYQEDARGKGLAGPSGPLGWSLCHPPDGLAVHIQLWLPHAGHSCLLGLPCEQLSRHPPGVWRGPGYGTGPQSARDALCLRLQTYPAAPQRLCCHHRLMESPGPSSQLALLTFKMILLPVVSVWTGYFQALASRPRNRSKGTQRLQNSKEIIQE